VCGELLPAAFEIDHIVPFSEGGDDSYLSENLVCLCPNDHAAKTQREAIARGKKQAAGAGSRHGAPRAGQRVLSASECTWCGRIYSTYFRPCCGGEPAVR